MKISDIKIGMSKSVQKVITREDTALNFGSGALNNLLATPTLVALMIEAGVAIILGVCKYIKENNIVPDSSIQVFITDYEEVSHGASSGIAENAEELLCVDMGAMGTGQNTNEYSVSICAKDSSGPYDYKMRNRLVNLAKNNGIDYRVDLYPRYISDASTALKAGMCLKTGLIGPGVFASHSYERTHLDSIRCTAELLLAYIRE